GPPAQATCAARRATLGLRDRIGKAGDGHTSWYRSRAVGGGGAAAPDLSGRIGRKAGSAPRGPADECKGRNSNGGRRRGSRANETSGPGEDVTGPKKRRRRHVSSRHCRAQQKPRGV